LFRHLPHHRSPTSATKPAGQDSGRSRVAGIVASTAPLAMEVQSFMDHLIALVLCLFEHFSASLGELALGNFVVRILSPRPPSPVSRVIAYATAEKPATSGGFMPAMRQESAIFTEGLWSVFKVFPFYGDQERRLFRSWTV